MFFFIWFRYNEVCNPGYGFLNTQPSHGTGAFTQMVWKTTKTFGIGKATTHEDGMLCTYIVGRYREKGNVVGSYDRNVLKGSFDFGYCDSLGKARRKQNKRLVGRSSDNVGSRRSIHSKNKKYKNGTQGIMKVGHGVENLMKFNQIYSKMKVTKLRSNVANKKTKHQR